MAKLTESPTLALLREAGEEPTRENFLNLAFLGNPPSKLDPEDEADLPAPFQTQTQERDRKLRDNAKKKREKAEKESQKK